MKTVSSIMLNSLSGSGGLKIPELVLVTGSGVVVMEELTRSHLDIVNLR